MSLYDNDWLDQTLHDREERVSGTLRRATLDEVRTLGAELFPVVTDPWFDKFNRFLARHPTGKYYLAEAPGGARVVYCHDTRSGMWFLPGGGMGIIQPRGIAKLAAMVEAM